jgi:hypothetical protein
MKQPSFNECKKMYKKANIYEIGYIIDKIL